MGQKANEIPLKKKVIQSRSGYSRPLNQVENTSIQEEIPRLTTNGLDIRHRSLPPNHSNSYAANSSRNSPRTLIIPRRNQILTPTYIDLLKYKGNLDAIQDNLGSRPPIDQEKHYKLIRIYWRGKVLWPSPNQLMQAKGDLNVLEQYPQITQRPFRPPSNSYSNSTQQFQDPNRVSH